MDRATHPAHRLSRIAMVLLAAAYLASWGCRSADEREAYTRLAGVERMYLYAAPRGDDGLRERLPSLDNDTVLSHYLEYAALNNPGLEAAFYRWKSAVERIPQARTLPDPMFSYAYFIRAMDTGERHNFELSQTFPWLAKLMLRSDVAAQDARAEYERYEAAKLTLFWEVRGAWAEYYYLGRSIEVTRDNIKLVQYLERVARIRYAAAEASHPDLIRAQVELGKLEDRLRSLLDMREPIAAKINAALGRPERAPVPWPKELPRETTTPDDAQVLAQLRRASPELLALQADVAKQEAAVRLADQNYFPDLTVGVGYGLAEMSEDKDPIMVRVSISLPIWWGSYRAAQREASAMRRAAKSALLDRENALAADTRMALFELRDAERKIRLYRDTLIPKATESLKATETAYKGGTETFFDLLEAQRVLLEFQLVHERALADRLKGIARIEMLTGQLLPEGKAASEEDAKPEAAD